MLDPRYLQVDLILSSEFNVAVLMVLIPRFPTQNILSCLADTGLETNQVQSDPGASALFAGADG